MRTLNNCHGCSSLVSGREKRSECADRLGAFFSFLLFHVFHGASFTDMPVGTVTDTSQRYRIRPRRGSPLRHPEDGSEDGYRESGALPSNKVPAVVAMPVPVPVPVEAGAVPLGGSTRPNPSSAIPLGGGVTPAPSGAVPLGGPRYRVNSSFQFPQVPSAQKGLQLNPGAMPQFSGVPPEQPAPPGAPAPPQPTAPLSDETPELTRMRAAEARLAEEQGVVPKKGNRLKAMLKMLAYGAKDMPMARDWGEFAYGAGRSVGSGIAGAVQPDLPGQIKKRYRVDEAQRNLEQAQKTGQVASQIQSRIDANKVRNIRLNRDLTKDEAVAEGRKRKTVADDLRRLPYIDPDNPTHAKILERAKEAGIDIDPASFGKGKNRPRIRVLDDDGVTEHWFEKAPTGDWMPIRIEGKDAISRLTDRRNPLTGETYSSAERRKLSREKFDFEKTESKIHDRQRDIALGYQKQGLDMRTASAQAEADAIDEMLPDLETQLMAQSDPDSGNADIAMQIQRMVSTLKDRRARASGAAGAGRPTPVTTSDATGRQWSSKAWQRAHRGGNVEAAKKKAAAAGAQVID